MVLLFLLSLLWMLIPFQFSFVSCVLMRVAGVVGSRFLVYARGFSGCTALCLFTSRVIVPLLPFLFAFLLFLLQFMIEPMISIRLQQKIKSKSPEQSIRSSRKPYMGLLWRQSINR